MKQEKTGLVLEGGGMRGIFTAGVLDVMMEEGLHFDGVTGHLFLAASLEKK